MPWSTGGSRPAWCSFRRGAPRISWKTRLNNLDPSFRTKRGRAVQHHRHLRRFRRGSKPGGPLIKDRLFLQQAAQYRYRTSDVPSRPQEDLKTAHAFSSFTRVDANLSAAALAGGGRRLLSERDRRTPRSAPSRRRTPRSICTAASTPPSVTERSLWTDSLFSETTVEVNRYGTEVMPQGAAPMELLPETTLGNFFNRQTRTTTTYQFDRNALGLAERRGGSASVQGRARSAAQPVLGTSASAPVLIRRSDGTLVRRLDFGRCRPTRRSTAPTWRCSLRTACSRTRGGIVEFGARLDRDGVIRRFNVTPRVGAAVLLNASGSAVMRSGFGLFYERTPSAAGVFEQYESAVDTRYARGRRHAARPADAVPRIDRSRAADVAQPDLGPGLRSSVQSEVGAARRASIDRHGSHELLVEPVADGDGSALQLHSDGRSRIAKPSSACTSPAARASI